MDEQVKKKEEIRIIKMLPDEVVTFYVNFFTFFEIII